MRIFCFTFLFWGSLFCYPQKNKISNKCITYVSNLNQDKRYSKDICYSVSIIDHIDLNEYRVGQKWDKNEDHWKFSIIIEDNSKKTKQTFNASFYIYEDDQDIKQYHCIVENYEVKALIYNKSQRSWQILMNQNDEYKILSSYPGYNFINAFGIISKQKSSINY